MPLLLLVAALSVATPAAPPLGWSLSGRVVDSAGAPIAGALIVIEEAHRSTTADRDGRYVLRDVPQGVYGVSYRAIGFRPAIRRITIADRDVTMDVTLQASVVELPPIQTTATPLATSALESPQPLTVLQGDALRRAQAASLGDVLDGQPGVRTFSTGNGIAKPVIRGLTGNRVLVLDNGQRTESQQWGDEHAPNVETASAERIEVVRGPASVLYGSDALGGVINVIPRELPDAGGGASLVRGRADVSFSSNGEMPEGAALLEGAAAGLGFRATASGRESGDVSSPTAVLHNSGLTMTSLGAAAGWRRSWGAITGNWSRRAERLEIHEDPEEEPDATPFQRVVTDRGLLTGNVSLGTSRLEADLGWERNARREFESVGAEAEGELELGLRATTWNSNLHLHHAASSRVAGVVGAQWLHTTVDLSGEETLVPASRTGNIAFYGFEQLDIGRWQLALGMRYDRRTLEHDAASELGVVAGQRDWSAVTGNAGVLFRLSEPAALVLNVGRGFRAPSAFELFANGVHEGTLRFEVGDPDLETERALNADLAIRLHNRVMRGELGVFTNRIAGYIYPDPTGEFDEESGLQVYRIVQGDATLRGVEGSIEWHASAMLHLRAGIDYTWGHNRTTDQPLAFIAPLRWQATARLEGEQLAGFVAPWLEAGVEVNAKQDRLDPEDVATDGYSLVQLGAGAAVAGIAVSVQVHNLLDTSYRAFLSRYKRYADEMGRSVRVSAGVEF
jgi:outer membrane receptor protein involved in Fe transport